MKIRSLATALRELPGVWVTLFLLAMVAAVNGLALWGIFAARRSALETARTELALETSAHARSLEAVLATLRGDLVFLSRSAPLRRYPRAVASADPLVRRWGRLEAEGSLLLFLEAHPAVHRLELRDGAGRTLARVGRKRGAPAVLTLDRAGSPSGDESGLWPGTFPFLPEAGEEGSVEVWIDPVDLLAIVAPGLGDRLQVRRGELEAPRRSGSGEGDRDLLARAGFAEEQWSPPIRGSLVRRETQSRLVSSVESLAGHYRITVLLSTLVMGLTLVLGTVALRQTRRAARLEAARRHQAEVHELERQLFHSERLASLGRLAAGLAHEINNPLEGMANYLSLLEDELRAGDPGSREDGTGGDPGKRKERAGRHLARLRQGLDRAAEAVRQVLTFADPARTPKERLDLVPVLVDTLEFVRSHSDFRPLRLRVDTPDTPLPVEGHRVTLGQLFLNLLLNARQVQPDGGEVEISAGSEGERVWVRIADRGPGLPSELGRRIFEPFVSTRDSSGLGLAVCHGIAEDHGGLLSGRNREGGGAVFEVTLPRAEAPAEPAGPERADSERADSERADAEAAEPGEVPSTAEAAPAAARRTRT